MSGWVMILWLVGIFVLPFVLGNLLASVLRMKEDGRRFGTILMVLFFCMAPFVSQLINGHNIRDAFRLGIDLAGGTNLVYQADRDLAQASQKEINSDSMDELTRAIGRRVNPSGTEEVTVRQVGEDRVEIIIPGADPDYVQSMKDKITRLGSLEFGILAARHDNAHRALISRAEQPGVDDVYDGNLRRAAWFPVARIQFGNNAGQLKDVEGNPSQDVFREREVNGETIREFLIILEPPDQKVDGRYLTSARQQMSDSGVAVGFNFNPRGGFLFQNLTSKYSPKRDGNKYRLAAILDGQIHSAPNINEMIGESGQITGSFTQEEVNELVSVLNAGALEVPLVKEPISEYTISPLLGVDVQEKGIVALTVAGISVLVFMLAYYWVAGIIANICLFINIVLVLGAMALIDATFTLPGMAGLVLTIGMAVDANVLIFERMREELNRGSSLRMAIQNGFGKAFSTILDANITTLISAVILYSIGTDQVKGFAVTLFIGISMSMFTALYVGRTFFDVLERMRMLSASTLLGKSIVGTTNFNFMKMRTMALVFSVVLMGVGLLVLISRGSDNLDIDFTGGSMVTFQFRDQPEIEETRQALQGEFGSDMSLERLVVPVPGSEQKTQVFFRLRTKNQDIEQVQQLVNEAFEKSPHDLLKISMEYTIPEPAATPEGETPAEEAPVQPGDAFANAPKAALTFSDEVTINAISTQFIQQYAKLLNTTPGDLAESVDLIRLTGTAGSGLQADESAVKRYSAMDLQVGRSITPEQMQQTLVLLQERMQTSPVLDEVSTFSSSVAGDTQTSALMAILGSLIAIIGYIWIRFEKVAYGLAAVVALIHDVACVLGLVAIASALSNTPIGAALGFTDFKINLPMIAAFLTIIGYSLNDTIVVFDRIRESRGKNPNLSEALINTSLNQTLSRTILTSFTTLMVVLVLYFMGGEGLHGFAFCLTMGILIGTYSTIFISCPALLNLAQRKPTAS